MQEGTAIAEVIRVTKHPVVEIAEGVQVGGCTVRARLFSPDAYSKGSFIVVKITKPSVFISLQHEKGSLMEHGEFSFDAGEELKVGDKLDILISSAAAEDPS
jgi:hypothetical protein